MQFEVKRKILKLVGSTIQTYDTNKQLICRADQKGFKLKEQIMFYRDDNKTQPIFSVQARNILDISATYDIRDVNGQLLASMKRNGMSSMFVRDEWLLLDANENQIGIVQEDSSTLGFLRRWIDMVALFLPQKLSVTIDGMVQGNLEQNKNPLTVRIKCNFSDDAVRRLGEYLTLAIPNMLAIIEQRQG